MRDSHHLAYTILRYKHTKRCLNHPSNHKMSTWLTYTTLRTLSSWDVSKPCAIKNTHKKCINRSSHLKMSTWLTFTTLRTLCFWLGRGWKLRYKHKMLSKSFISPQNVYVTHVHHLTYTVFFQGRGWVPSQRGSSLSGSRRHTVQNAQGVVADRQVWASEGHRNLHPGGHQHGKGMAQGPCSLAS